MRVGSRRRVAIKLAPPSVTQYLRLRPRKNLSEPTLHANLLGVLACWAQPCSVRLPWWASVPTPTRRPLVHACWCAGHAQPQRHSMDSYGMPYHELANNTNRRSYLLLNKLFSGQGLSWALFVGIRAFKFSIYVWDVTSISSLTNIIV